MTRLISDILKSERYKGRFEFVYEHGTLEEIEKLEEMLKPPVNGETFYALDKFLTSIEEREK